MSVEVINGQQTKLSGLPAHWKQTRMGSAVGEYQLEKNEDPNPVVLSLTKEGVKVKTDLSFGKSTENYVGHQIVEEGQFVFTPRDFDATPILCGIGQTRGCISNLYMVFDVAEDFDTQFLEYYFWGLKWGYDYFAQLSYGMRYSFNREQFERIPLAWPDLEEQKQIVAYLDRETARIDGLIEKKNRFIALLKEKRVAVIAHAVTKGLNRNAPMKAGDFKAIGAVPAHWDISPVSRALMLSKSTVGKRSDEFKLLSLTTRGVIERDISENFGKFPESFDTYQQVQPGNFVFCLFDIDETPRTVGRSDLHGMITGAYAVFECIAPAYSDFLYYLFLHLDNFKGLKPFYTGLRKTIRPPRFTSIRVPFPPEDEAKRIVEHIEHETAKIDTLITKTEQSIALLKEKRAALITAAVTGKIDVRTAA
ncbi:hypothetical protein HAT86_08880 [Roseovarius gahaiensis]|uniref:Type I restriction enzyme, S subunit n=1 Tax=Roseovarius gahaiensis TaxID=2716691 RepID=A0A967BHM7_9RHOB|nr:restriction endonuclease subunit S [Roseovarius gahaiensis]NHQ74577.1 hypothetical protein [Roseovarius gahaiensis]